MKTYYLQFIDFREEAVKASSVRMTATMVSFYRRKSLVLAAPVSEFRRIAETPFKSYDELEEQKRQEEEMRLAPVRAKVEEILAKRKTEAVNGATN